MPSARLSTGGRTRFNHLFFSGTTKLLFTIVIAFLVIGALTTSIAAAAEENKNNQQQHDRNENEKNEEQKSPPVRWNERHVDPNNQQQQQKRKDPSKMSHQEFHNAHHYGHHFQHHQHFSKVHQNLHKNALEHQKKAIEQQKQILEQQQKLIGEMQQQQQARGGAGVRHEQIAQHDSTSSDQQKQQQQQQQQNRRDAEMINEQLSRREQERERQRSTESKHDAESVGRAEAQDTMSDAQQQNSATGGASGGGAASSSTPDTDDEQMMLNENQQQQQSSDQEEYQNSNINNDINHENDLVAEEILPSATRGEHEQFKALFDSAEAAEEENNNKYNNNNNNDDDDFGDASIDAMEELEKRQAAENEEDEEFQDHQEHHQQQYQQQQQNQPDQEEEEEEISTAGLDQAVQRVVVTFKPGAMEKPIVQIQVNQEAVLAHQRKQQQKNEEMIHKAFKNEFSSQDQKKQQSENENEKDDKNSNKFDFGDKLFLKKVQRLGEMAAEQAKVDFKRISFDDYEAIRQGIPLTDDQHKHNNEENEKNQQEQPENENENEIDDDPDNLGSTDVSQIMLGRDNQQDQQNHHNQEQQKHHSLPTQQRKGLTSNELDDLLGQLGRKLAGTQHSGAVEQLRAEIIKMHAGSLNDEEEKGNLLSKLLQLQKSVSDDDVGGGGENNNQKNQNNQNNNNVDTNDDKGAAVLTYLVMPDGSLVYEEEPEEDEHNNDNTNQNHALPRDQQNLQQQNTPTNQQDQQSQQKAVDDILNGVVGEKDESQFHAQNQQQSQKIEKSFDFFGFEEAKEKDEVAATAAVSPSRHPSARERQEEKQEQKQQQQQRRERQEEKKTASSSSSSSQKEEQAKELFSKALERGPIDFISAENLDRHEKDNKKEMTLHPIVHNALCESVCATDATTKSKNLNNKNLDKLFIEFVAFRSSTEVVVTAATAAAKLTNFFLDRDRFSLEALKTIANFSVAFDTFMTDEWRLCENSCPARNLIKMFNIEMKMFSNNNENGNVSQNSQQQQRDDELKNLIALASVGLEKRNNNNENNNNDNKNSNEGQLSHNHHLFNLAAGIKSSLFLAGFAEHQNQNSSSLTKSRRIQTSLIYRLRALRLRNEFDFLLSSSSSSSSHEKKQNLRPRLHLPLADGYDAQPPRFANQRMQRVDDNLNDHALYVQHMQRAAGRSTFESVAAIAHSLLDSAAEMTAQAVASVVSLFSSFSSSSSSTKDNNNRGRRLFVRRSRVDFPAKFLTPPPSSSSNENLQRIFVASLHGITIDENDNQEEVLLSKNSKKYSSQYDDAGGGVASIFRYHSSSAFTAAQRKYAAQTLKEAHRILGKTFTTNFAKIGVGSASEALAIIQETRSELPYEASVSLSRVLLSIAEDIDAKKKNKKNGNHESSIKTTTWKRKHQTPESIEKNNHFVMSLMEQRFLSSDVASSFEGARAALTNLLDEWRREQRGSNFVSLANVFVLASLQCASEAFSLRSAAFGSSSPPPLTSSESLFQIGIIISKFPKLFQKYVKFLEQNQQQQQQSSSHNLCLNVHSLSHLVRNFDFSDDGSDDHQEDGKNKNDENENMRKLATQYFYFSARGGHAAATYNLAVELLAIENDKEQGKWQQRRLWRFLSPDLSPPMRQSSSSSNTAVDLPLVVSALLRRAARFGCSHAQRALLLNAASPRASFVSVGDRIATRRSSQIFFGSSSSSSSSSSSLNFKFEEEIISSLAFESANKRHRTSSSAGGGGGGGQQLFGRSFGGVGGRVAMAEADKRRQESTLSRRHRRQQNHNKISEDEKFETSSSSSPFAPAASFFTRSRRQQLLAQSHPVISLERLLAYAAQSVYDFALPTRWMGAVALSFLRDDVRTYLGSLLPSPSAGVGGGGIEESGDGDEEKEEEEGETIDAEQVEKSNNNNSNNNNNKNDNDNNNINVNEEDEDGEDLDVKLESITTGPPPPPETLLEHILHILVEFYEWCRKIAVALVSSSPSSSSKPSSSSSYSWTPEKFCKSNYFIRAEDALLPDIGFPDQHLLASPLQLDRTGQPLTTHWGGGGRHFQKRRWEALNLATPERIMSSSSSSSTFSSIVSHEAGQLFPSSSTPPSIPDPHAWRSQKEWRQLRAQYKNKINNNYVDDDQQKIRATASLAASSLAGIVKSNPDFHNLAQSQKFFFKRPHWMKPLVSSSSSSSSNQNGDGIINKKFSSANSKNSNNKKFSSSSSSSRTSWIPKTVGSYSHGSGSFASIEASDYFFGALDNSENLPDGNVFSISGAFAGELWKKEIEDVALREATERNNDIEETCRNQPQEEGQKEHNNGGIPSLFCSLFHLSYLRLSISELVLHPDVTVQSSYSLQVINLMRLSAVADLTNIAALLVPVQATSTTAYFAAAYGRRLSSLMRTSRSATANSTESNQHQQQQQQNPHRFENDQKRETELVSLASLNAISASSSSLFQDAANFGFDIAAMFYDGVTAANSAGGGGGGGSVAHLSSFERLWPFYTSLVTKSIFRSVGFVKQLSGGAGGVADSSFSSSSVNRNSSQQYRNRNDRVKQFENLLVCGGFAQSLDARQAADADCLGQLADFVLPVSPEISDNHKNKNKNKNKNFLINLTIFFEAADNVISKSNDPCVLALRLSDNKNRDDDVVINDQFSAENSKQEQQQQGKKNSSAVICPSLRAIPFASAALSQFSSSHRQRRQRFFSFSSSSSSSSTSSSSSSSSSSSPLPGATSLIYQTLLQTTQRDYTFHNQQHVQYQKTEVSLRFFIADSLLAASVALTQEQFFNARARAQPFDAWAVLPPAHRRHHSSDHFLSNKNKNSVFLKNNENRSLDWKLQQKADLKRRHNYNDEKMKKVLKLKKKRGASTKSKSTDPQEDHQQQKRQIERQMERLQHDLAARRHIINALDALVRADPHLQQQRNQNEQNNQNENNNQRQQQHVIPQLAEDGGGNIFYAQADNEEAAFHQRRAEMGAYVRGGGGAAADDAAAALGEDQFHVALTDEEVNALRQMAEDMKDDHREQQLQQEIESVDEFNKEEENYNEEEEEQEKEKAELLEEQRNDDLDKNEERDPDDESTEEEGENQIIETNKESEDNADDHHNENENNVDAGDENANNNDNNENEDGEEDDENNEIFDYSNFSLQSPIDDGERKKRNFRERFLVAPGIVINTAFPRLTSRVERMISSLSRGTRETTPLTASLLHWMVFLSRTSSLRISSFIPPELIRRQQNQDPHKLQTRPRQEYAKFFDMNASAMLQRAASDLKVLFAEHEKERQRKPQSLFDHIAQLQRQPIKPPPAAPLSAFGVLRRAVFESTLDDAAAGHLGKILDKVNLIQTKMNEENLKFGMKRRRRRRTFGIRSQKNIVEENEEEKTSFEANKEYRVDQLYQCDPSSFSFALQLLQERADYFY